MKCDLCGSKKNVRVFQSSFGKPPYKECRKCFELIMRQACNFHGLKLDNEAIEVEWNKGKGKYPD